MSQPITENDPISPDRKDTLSGVSYFLVCGLGSLGQYCVAIKFGMAVSAIDVAQPSIWEVPSVPDSLEDLVLGDCRQPDVLEKAKIQQCRILLVTSDERVNIDAAFAIRVINPKVRLVVRAKENLNELLDQRLGNFVAIAATQLTAPAFAIAALDSEIQEFIDLGDRLLRVVKYPINQQHRWCDIRLLHELNSKNRRLLSHIPAATELPPEFYQWEPDVRIRAGDIVYIEESQRPDYLQLEANPATKKT